MNDQNYLVDFNYVWTLSLYLNSFIMFRHFHYVSTLLSCLNTFIMVEHFYYVWTLSYVWTHSTIIFRQIQIVPLIILFSLKNNTNDTTLYLKILSCWAGPPSLIGLKRNTLHKWKCFYESAELYMYICRGSTLPKNLELLIISVIKKNYKLKMNVFLNRQSFYTGQSLLMVF